VKYAERPLLGINNEVLELTKNTLIRWLISIKS